VEQILVSSQIANCALVMRYGSVDRTLKRHILSQTFCGSAQQQFIAKSPQITMKERMLFWQTLVEDINFTVKMRCLYATLFAHKHVYALPTLKLIHGLLMTNQQLLC